MGNSLRAGTKQSTQPTQWSIPAVNTQHTHFSEAEQPLHPVSDRTAILWDVNWVQICHFEDKTLSHGLNGYCIQIRDLRQQHSHGTRYYQVCFLRVSYSSRNTILVWYLSKHPDKLDLILSHCLFKVCLFFCQHKLSRTLSRGGEDTTSQRSLSWATGAPQC